MNNAQYADQRWDLHRLAENSCQQLSLAHIVILQCGARDSSSIDHGRISSGVAQGSNYSTAWRSHSRGPRTGQATSSRGGVYDSKLKEADLRWTRHCPRTFEQNSTRAQAPSLPMVWPAASLG